MNMKLFTSVFLALALCRSVLAADPSGHWEGEITLPGTSLAIRVDLASAAGAWSGTIDIPAQSLRGFQLDAVTVAGADVSFAMPGIPGDPKFSGQAGADQKAIQGDFTQGGQTFPFKLERAAAPAATGETPAKGLPGQGWAGVWQGTLQVTPVVGLRLLLEITNAPGHQFNGAIVSMDQGNARIPLAAFAEKDGAAHLEAASVHGQFDGQISADGSEIAGRWKQNTLDLELTFKRINKEPSLTRPQDPKKPYPYDVENVVIEHDGIKLAGTLTLPRGPGPRRAVILIAGSGPHDRDEAIMGHRPFLIIADRLTRDGVIVLRCDKRGCGKSTGDYASATDADFVEDTLAQVAWLAARPEVDTNRLGLVGHSEGGIIAPLAAVKSPGVKFIVLLAGVGRPMEGLLERQDRDVSRTLGATDETIASNAAFQRKMFQVIKEDRSPGAADKLRELYHQQMAQLTDQQRKALGLTDSAFEAQIAMVLTPWFRSLLVYDPRSTLQAVKCPVLALNGDKDLQVASKENLASIREALLAGGNTHVTTVELPGLNHLFQTCQTGAISEYSQIEETFSPKALALISDWIGRQ
jgi:uncharacterized protein